MRQSAPFLVFACIHAAAALPPHLSSAAGHLKRLAGGAGLPGCIACRNIDMAQALKREGLGIDPRSRVAWATTAAQARAFRGEGKFVVCADPALLQEGTALALRMEGGQVRLELHRQNAHASGLPLSETLLKGARLL